MEYYQGLNYTHVRCHRSKFEKLQDLLYSLNAFPNGVRISPLAYVCILPNSNALEIVKIGIKKDLIEEIVNGIYNKTEKGEECNFIWYAIRDRCKLGDIKNGDEVISKSVISSIFHVEPVPLSKKMKDKLRLASSSKIVPKYPPEIKRMETLLLYFLLVKSCGTEPETRYKIIMAQKTQKCMSNYGMFNSCSDSALTREHIVEVYHDKKSKKICRTESGTALLNTINWYANKYKIEELLPIGNNSSLTLSNP
jgi:predicted transcriptional regulator